MVWDRYPVKKATSGVCGLGHQKRTRTQNSEVPFCSVAHNFTLQARHITIRHIMLGGGGFKYVLLLPLLGEMIQFDFGLKPPSSMALIYCLISYWINLLSWHLKKHCYFEIAAAAFNAPNGPTTKPIRATHETLPPEVKNGSELVPKPYHLHGPGCQIS